MKYYVGLDVSLATTAVCVVDLDGQVVFEASVESVSGVIADTLLPYRADLEIVGLEAGPMSERLTRGLVEAGLPVTQMETRQVAAALSAQMEKTDRNDARGMAKLLRLGWFRPVHLKSQEARDRRLLLSARKTLQGRLVDVENSVRGLLRGFGLRPGRFLRKRWDAEIRDLIAGHPALEIALMPLLAVRESLRAALGELTDRVREEVLNDPVCQRLMTVPGVGPLVALTYVATIDDPTRFRSSKQVGASVGLTPRRYQSGEQDRAGRITKCGDPALRVALFEAANVMLVCVKRWFPLRSWAMRVAARRGAKRAKVALARKIAVILHRMWVDETDFQMA